MLCELALRQRKIDVNRIVGLFSKWWKGEISADAFRASLKEPIAAFKITERDCPEYAERLARIREIIERIYDKSGKLTPAQLIDDLVDLIWLKEKLL